VTPHERAYKGWKPPSYKSILGCNGVDDFGPNVASNGAPDNPFLSNRDLVVNKAIDTTMKDLSQSSNEPNKWKLGQCIPKAEEMPKYEKRFEHIGNYVQSMKDHILI